MRRMLYPVIYFHKQIGISILLGCLLLTMVALCATTEDVDGATGMVKTIYNLIDDIFDTAQMDDLTDLLLVEYGGGTLRAGGIAFTGLTTVITVMHRTFQNLGMMMLIVFLGVGLLESITFNQMYVEKLIRQFIFFCIGIVLISKSMDMVFGISNIFSALIQKIVDNTSVSNADMATGILNLKKSIYDNCNVSTGTGITASLSDAVSNLTTAVSYLIQLFIPSLISKLANVVISVMCWSRFIEIILMGIVSPLTVCDISAGGGMNSSAVKGVKNVIALGLSGAVMMLSVFICQQIQFGILAANAMDGANFMSCVWKEIVVAIVEVGLVVKSSGIAKQMLGMG